MRPAREIPQRELRNDVAAVLREVEGGAMLRVTVRGRPIADLVPVKPRPSVFEPDEVRRIVADAPLDERFAEDLDGALGATIDEL